MAAPSIQEIIVPPTKSEVVPGPVYGFRVLNAPVNSYVKLNDGRKLQLTALFHVDTTADAPFSKLEFHNPSDAYGANLVVHVQAAANAPFAGSPTQKFQTNPSNHLMVQMVATDLSDGASAPGTPRLVRTDENGCVRTAESIPARRAMVSDWSGIGALEDGTFYLDDEVIATEPVIIDTDGASAVAFSLSATGASVPGATTMAFFLDELDDDGNVIEAHPLGTSNSWAAGGTGRIILGRGVGLEDGAGLRRRGTVPSRVRVRYTISGGALPDYTGRAELKVYP